MGTLGTNILIALIMAAGFLALCAWISKLIAQNKGYDGGQGLRAGLFLGIFGIAVYLLMPERISTTELSDHEFTVREGTCPSCGAGSQIFEGFCVECGARVEPGRVIPREVREPGEVSVGLTASGSFGGGGPGDGSALPPGAREALAQAGVPEHMLPVTGPGKTAAVERPTREEFCPRCMQPRQFYAGFCTTCGAHIDSAIEDEPAAVGSATGATAAAGPAQAGRSEPELAEKLCPGCGRISTFENGRCTSCGTQLEL